MCLNVCRNRDGLRSQGCTAIYISESFQSQTTLASELKQFTLLQGLMAIQVFLYIALSDDVFYLVTFLLIVWFLHVDSVLFTLAPVAVGQLRDSRRSEPSQKHSIQPLPATLSGTQTGPSQCCFFWKINKVHFYGTTNQEIGNQVSIEKIIN